MVRIPLSLVLVEAALGAMLVVTCTTHSAPLDDLREQPRAPRVVPARPETTPAVRLRAPSARPHALLRERASRPHRRSPAFAARLKEAVAAIPGYDEGDATWIVTPRYGTWGTTDPGAGVIYISPAVPRARLYDVAAHEWSHVVSVRAYAGDAHRAFAAMNRWFGGTGLVGAERAADCMARQLGAVWTNYTACADARWRAGASRLLAGRPL